MKFPFQLREDRKFDVVGFGTNAVDFLIEVPAYPAFNSKVELTRYTQAPGGEVATTIAGLQRLGIATSYIGRFGDDAAGEVGLQSLTAEGVDVGNSESVAGARTQVAFIIIDERNGERTVIWKRDEALAYSASDAPTSGVSDTKVLHCTPHDVDASIAMAKEAKQYGVIVSSDIDNVFDGIELLLPYVDILITSQDFPKKLLGISDRNKGLKELRRRFGCEIVGVTLGEEGSLLLSGDKFISSDGFAVPGGCRDTTGAGDAFRAGLLFGMLTGETVETASRMANAVAALKCRATGARTALPTPDELNSLVAKRGS